MNLQRKRTATGLLHSTANSKTWQKYSEWGRRIGEKENQTGGNYPVRLPLSPPAAHDL